MEKREKEKQERTLLTTSVLLKSAKKGQEAHVPFLFKSEREGGGGGRKSVFDEEGGKGEVETGGGSWGGKKRKRFRRSWLRFWSKGGDTFRRGGGKGGKSVIDYLRPEAASWKSRGRTRKFKQRGEKGRKRRRKRGASFRLSPFQERSVMWPI